MTIFATHFALVLGAWRLRVRIDLDEPRESELREQPAAAPAAASGAVAAPPAIPQVTSWGRG
jgi:hypothetical protein